MKSPRSVDAEIIASCNLRCAYCSHFSGPGDVEKDLPLGTWLRFFEELKGCAVMNVTLSGGEPFYRPDLREIIQGIVANRMRFSILNNGPRQTIAVRVDGGIIPCLQLGHLVLGRINHDDLLDVWQNHTNLRKLREHSLIPLASLALCRECPYTSHCTGNCPTTAYTIAGEVNHPSPDASLRLFQEQGVALLERSTHHQSG